MTGNVSLDRFTLPLAKPLSDFCLVLLVVGSVRATGMQLHCDSVNGSCCPATAVTVTAYWHSQAGHSAGCCCVHLIPLSLVKTVSLGRCIGSLARMTQTPSPSQAARPTMIIAAKIMVLLQNVRLWSVRGTDRSELDPSAPLNRPGTPRLIVRIDRLVRDRHAYFLAITDIPGLPRVALFSVLDHLGQRVAVHGIASLNHFVLRTHFIPLSHKAARRHLLDAG